MFDAATRPSPLSTSITSPDTDELFRWRPLLERFAIARRRGQIERADQRVRDRAPERTGAVALTGREADRISRDGRLIAGIAMAYNAIGTGVRPGTINLSSARDPRSTMTC